MVIENSPRLRTLGGDRVLSDLEGHGYACWPLVVGAIHAGSPQIRKRAFIVAHSKSDRRGPGRPWGFAASPTALQDLAHGDGVTDLHGLELREQPGRRGGACGAKAVVPSILAAWEDGPFDGEPLDNGLPEDVDTAIKAYGNAVLPQLTELIGRAIMKVTVHV